MDIIESIKQQIDDYDKYMIDSKVDHTRELYATFIDNKMNLEKLDTYEIFVKMKDIDILYRIKFSLLVDEALHTNMTEYAHSNYSWSLIQHYCGNLRNIHLPLPVESFSAEKLINLTSSRLYSVLLHNMLFMNYQCFDTFVNYYHYIDDQNTKVLRDLLNVILHEFNHDRCGRQQSGWRIQHDQSSNSKNYVCYPQLSAIKPFIFNQNEIDEDDSDIDAGLMLFKAIIKREFREISDISNMEIIDIIIQNNKILDYAGGSSLIASVRGDYDHHHHKIVSSLIVIFPSLSLSEQIHFGSNICKFFSIYDILNHMNDGSNEFTDYIFNNYPVSEWFDSNFSNIEYIGPYFCHKLLSVSAYLKDKIMIKALINESNVLDIFPDINNYDVNNLIQKIIDGKI